MTGFETIVSNVGFPIAAFYLIYKLYRNEKQNMREEREEWKTSVQELTKVLQEMKTEIKSREVYVKNSDKNNSQLGDD